MDVAAQGVRAELVLYGHTPTLGAEVYPILLHGGGCLHVIRKFLVVHADSLLLPVNPLGQASNV